MPAYAQLDENNIVINVITLDDFVIDKDLDLEFSGSDETYCIGLCKKIVQDDSSIWKLSSDNGEFRGNPAAVGYTYMERVATLGVASTDIFIQRRTYPSWGISTTSAEWVSPLGPQPTLTDEERSLNQYYDWDEYGYAYENTGWVLRTTNEGSLTTNVI